MMSGADHTLDLGGRPSMAVRVGQPRNPKPESRILARDRPAMKCKLFFPFKFWERKTHKHKQIAGLSQDWVGAKIMFMCFFRVIPYGGEKTHKQSPPPKIPGQSREVLVYVSFVLSVFFLLPLNKNSADVWKKGVWDFQVFSQAFFEL